MNTQSPALESMKTEIAARTLGLAAAALIAACSSNGPPVAVTTPPPAASSVAAPELVPSPRKSASKPQLPRSLPGTGITFTGGDGSTRERAVIVHGVNGSMDNAHVEFDYLLLLHGDALHLHAHSFHREGNLAIHQQDYWVGDDETMRSIFFVEGD